jgi:hypothetical protein
MREVSSWRKLQNFWDLTIAATLLTGVCLEHAFCEVELLVYGVLRHPGVGCHPRFAYPRFTHRCGTVPHAAKMPMSAISPEVVERMHHCMPSGS